MLKDAESFSELVKNAKNRFKDDPEMLEVLNEMEADVSFQSRVTGTLLTFLLCEEQKQ